MHTPWAGGSTGKRSEGGDMEKGRAVVAHLYRSGTAGYRWAAALAGRLRSIQRSEVAINVALTMWGMWTSWIAYWIVFRQWM